MVDEIIEWDLSDFYESIIDPNIEKDIKFLLKTAEKFNQKVKGKVDVPSLTPEQLIGWLQEYENISEKSAYLQFYALLSYSTNTLNDEIKTFHSKIEEIAVEIQEKVLFFPLEFNLISDDKYNEMRTSPLLKNYFHVLEKIRKKKPHQLSEKEEQIILMKNLTGVNGFIKFYSELKSSFIYDFEVDGESKKLTEAELFAYMYQPDRELRYRALQTIVKKYRDNEMVFTHIFNNILKDWGSESKKKNYRKPISRRNLRNEVSDEIVEVLGNVSTNNYQIVEKYYNLKKKLLGLDELHISDLYAPSGEISKHYSYSEAIELIKTVNEKFHPEFKDIVEKMHELEHIDATPRKGKNRGAFCEFGKLNHYPFVFVNFTKMVDSVLTLSHELGHAIQGFYIQRDQNFLNMGISLAVAEIASVFNEMLTLDYLMSSDLTKEEKISLLCIFIEKNIGTSFRQNAFYNFEVKIHDMIEKKLPTTTEIKQIFIGEMKKMFGKSMTNLEEEYAEYCFVVPHFLNSPFYVYAYNMSNLLVISLYKLYLEQKEEFIPKFIKLISIGTSLSPEEMLATIDIDLNDSSFWQKGIDYLASKVEELNNLVNS
jgi:oligoendopeptidase F